MRSDHELLEAWRAGDQAAGSELFDRHFDALYRFFRNKAPDGVDDLVQRTMLACVEGRERIRGEFVHYMFGVACRQLLREYAQRARDRQIDFAVSSAQDMAPSPSSLLAAHDRQAVLSAALRRIPLDNQVVLELRYIEGLSGPAIADVVGIPEPTVRSRLFRGLIYVRQRVEELESDPARKREALAEIETWEREAPALGDDPEHVTTDAPPPAEQGDGDGQTAAPSGA